MMVPGRMIGIRPSLRGSEDFKARPLKLLRTSLGFSWRASPLMTIGSMLLGLMSAIGLVGTVFATRFTVQRALDLASSGASPTRIALSALPVLVATLFRRVVGFLNQLLTYELALETDRVVFEELMTKISAVPLEKFEDPTFFAVVQRLSGAGFIKGAVQLVTGVLASVIAIVAVGAAVARMNPYLLLTIVVAAVPSFVALRAGNRMSYALQRMATPDSLRRMYLESVLIGRSEAKEVRAFSLFEPLRDLWREARSRTVAIGRRSWRISQLLSTATDAFSGAAMGIAGGVVIMLVARHKIGLGEATAVLVAVRQAMNSSTTVVTNMSGLHSSGILFQDYETLMSFPSPDPSAQVERFSSLAEVSLSNADFSYPGTEVLALDDVNVTLVRGEMIALVGENGAGKTTLAKVLCGLYSPTAGELRWNGDLVTDARQICDDITILFQDFARYELTVRENIGLGRYAKMARGEGIEAAAAAAGVDSFIDSLADGYDTQLGRRFGKGTDLSIGQWQKVATARAMFRDASLIVLDEPTASLDPRAEAELFDAMRTLFAGRTVILISHRFSSVRNADRTYVLDKGRITESGSHAELMALGGNYAEMFTLQAKNYLAERDDSRQTP